ncbi:MAG: hypothetical protein ABIL68_02855 [bacterium]
MKTDTNKEAEKVQVALIQKASPQERISLMCSLTETAVALSRRAISRSHPGLSKCELDLLFVEYHYGTDLANRLREYLDQKK